MTVIYVDTLFLLNAVIDYLLLLASARLAGEPLRRGRFALGAALGGLYAVGLFLPGFSFLRRPFYKVVSAVMILLLAYGVSRRLLRQGLVFMLLTCAFGGMVAAIGMMGGQGLALGHGVVYSSLDRKVVFLAAAVCYVVVSVAFQRMGKHSVSAGEILMLKLGLMGRTVELPALLDTGNTLTDPVSGQGVVVAETAAVLPLFPVEVQAHLHYEKDPAEQMNRLGEGQLCGRLRLLPYRTVGVSCGLLLAVRMDWMEVEGKRREGMLMALSPTSLSDGGGYRAMIGKDGVL